MKNCTDIMLDLETFSTSFNAAIVNIGAVAFCESGNVNLNTYGPDALCSLGDGFRVAVDLNVTAPDKRGDLDPATVEWWLRQSKEARQHLVSGGHSERLPLGTALQAFRAWVETVCEDPSKVRLWSKGPTFDEVILRSAFDRYGMSFPLHFRNSRDCRTIAELAWGASWSSHTMFKSAGLIQHDALSDAIYQARELDSQRHYLSNSFEQGA